MRGNLGVIDHAAITSGLSTRVFDAGRGALDEQGRSRDNDVVRRAMILCAGYGTRLRPLTEERPKPLVPLGDRPLLAHLAAQLLRANVQELVVNSHYKASEFSFISQWIESKVHVLLEEDILGTAGGIAAARPLLEGDTALVMNGDILCRPPVERLLAEAGEGLTLAVRRRPRGEGTVGLDEQGRVVRLRGRTFGDESSGGEYVGVAALGPACLATLPERGCLVGDWALPELERGGRIGTVEYAGDWLDVGSPAAYWKAHLLWLEELEGAGRGWFDLSGVDSFSREQRSWQAPTARVEPTVRLEQSVVGAGATVEGTGTLERCVIWPGARVRAPLANAVITSAGRIVSCLDSAAR